MSMRAIKIGVVGIDSGHVVIMDPGMARSLEFSVPYFVTPAIHGVAKKLDFPSAVIGISGHGDGDYPIYALYDDEGDYVGLTICFFPEDVDYQFDIIESDPFLQLDPLQYAVSTVRQRTSDSCRRSFRRSLGCFGKKRSC